MGIDISNAIRMIRDMSPSRIRRLRKRLGLSQQAFADRIGADQSTVSRWEQKGARPSGPAIKLLEYLEACAAPALSTAVPRSGAEAA